MPRREERNPLGPLFAQLGGLRWTKDLLGVVNAAGIVFDLALSDKDNYSHSKRIAAYLPRIQRAIKKLSLEDQLASGATLAAELVARQLADAADLARALEPLGWQFVDDRFIPPAARGRPRGGRSAAAVTTAGPLRTAVIYAALELEAEAMIAHLQDPREEHHPQGTVYVCGMLQDGAARWRVAVVTGGMGNAAAAVEVERAAAHFRPELVLLVGIAGGLKDVQLGDVVAAEKVHAYEGGKSAEHFSPRPTSWIAGYAALQRARHEVRSGRWVRRIKGSASSPVPRAIVKPIAAGEKVLSSQKSAVVELVRTTYGDAVAVEMEGAGFSLASHANDGVNALVIRGISDLVDGKAAADEAGWQHTAARHAAAFAAEFLLRYRPVANAPRSYESSAAPTPPPHTAETRAPYTPDSSTPFFQGRMADAFPGRVGLCAETSGDAAIERLQVLLAPPLGDGRNSSIWEVGYGTMPVRSFRAEAGGIVRLDQHRYRIDRLVGYRARRYWHDFVLMYWAAEETTGLYGARSSEEIAEELADAGRCTEEYGLWGTTLVTRQEYDDGSVFRDGKLQGIEARLEVRQLAAGATFLVAQLSPVNDHRFDADREALLKDHSAGGVTVEEIVTWVTSLPRHGKDDY